MKIFWPYHSKAKGFSIENLADKNCKETLSVSSLENLNQFTGDSNLKAISRDIKHIATSNLSVQKRHWANRDFSEYREAA